MMRRLLAPLAAAVLAACGSSGSVSTDPISRNAVDPGNAGGNKHLTVMTRNLYVGGDLFEPFRPHVDPLAAASTVWGDILASDPGARMGAIADEILAAKADLVAVEEAYHFIVTPLGATTPVLLDLDYLGSLAQALDARACVDRDADHDDGDHDDGEHDDADEHDGDHHGRDLAVACSQGSGDDDDQGEDDGCEARYRVVAWRAQTTITIPFPDRGVQITMIDRDAILARSGVLIRSSGGGTFEAHYATTLAGVIPVKQTRGWVSVQAKHEGRPFTFVATHLETQEFGPLQSLQAMELAARFASADPIILAGDTNSDPADPAYDVTIAGLPYPIPTPYTIFTSAPPPLSYRDAASAVGDTCCFVADLRPPSSLYERVDLVLVRGALTPKASYRVGTDPLAALGNRWPSDHAGVVATIRLEDPKFYALK